MSQSLAYPLPTSWLWLRLSKRIAALVFFTAVFVVMTLPSRGADIVALVVYAVLVSVVVASAAFDVHDFKKHRVFLRIEDGGIWVFGAHIPWVAISDIVVGDHTVIPVHLRPSLIIMLRDPSVLPRWWGAIGRVIHPSHQNVWLSGFLFDVHVDHVRSAIQPFFKKFGKQNTPEEGHAQKRGDAHRRQDLVIIAAMLCGFAGFFVRFVLPQDTPLQVRLLMFASICGAAAMYVIAGLRNLKK